MPGADECTAAPAVQRRVGIMQPYFLPYFEHFRLMAACDLWVVFDTAQYTRKSWMNRNRVINRDKGWSYISVPVRSTGLHTTAEQAQVDDSQDWRGRLLDKLKVYAHEAPHYRTVRALIGDLLAPRIPTLAALNLSLLEGIKAYLGIRTPLLRASALDIDWPADCAPGEWALHIARHVGATAYRNPAGGVALFDPALYARHGIELSFHQPRELHYPTGSFAFVPGLSVVDWMMWNDREQLCAWLD